MDPHILSDRIATILSDKKAKDVDVIDTANVTDIADFFIICSGTSTTHIRALVDEVDFQLSQDGIIANHKEGYDTARWILMDYSSVVVHVFHEEDRQYYSLEKLWSDGKITRKS